MVGVAKPKRRCVDDSRSTPGARRSPATPAAARSQSPAPIGGTVSTVFHIGPDSLSAVHAHHGQFSLLFLDLTDTWFVGRGPSLATFGKTKEGLYRRKVGIALLCDEVGHPLRWSVVEGRRHDGGPMKELAWKLQSIDWARGVPLVLDRAMGATAHIEELLATGRPFITALSRNEFDAYTDRVPCSCLSEMPWNTPNAARCAAEAVVGAGMERVHDDLYVLQAALARLARNHVVEACQVSVWTENVDGREVIQVSIEPDPEAWSLRQRFFGFQIIVARPDDARSAPDLVAVYRAKDGVEKDFQTIKSVLCLRPVRHRTDAKVRAHVTLCMLALLVERVIDIALEGQATGPAALDALSDIHLNRIKTRQDSLPAYTITRPKTDHLALLRALGMTHLVDDTKVTATLYPR